jgi:hypothetical protein
MSNIFSEENILSNYLDKIPKLYQKFHSFDDIKTLNEDNEDFKEMKKEFLSILKPFTFDITCNHSELDYLFLKDEENFRVLKTLPILNFLNNSREEVTIVDKMCVELHIRLCQIYTFEGFYEYIENGFIVLEYQKFCCRCREHIGKKNNSLSRNITKYLTTRPFAESVNFNLF